MVEVGTWRRSGTRRGAVPDHIALTHLPARPGLFTWVVFTGNAMLHNNSFQTRLH